MEYDYIKNEIIVNNNIKFRKDCFYAEDIEFFFKSFY